MKALLAATLLVGAAIAAAPTATPPVNDAAIIGDGFPATLAEFGFFTDGAAQRPAAGVTPYRLQTPLWSDGADKQRFVYVPQGAKVRAQGDALLDFPPGSALIKSFRLDGRLIETRVLLRRAQGWVALPYQWNADQTEARLAARGPGGQAISYAIPNKNQCKECHAAGGAVTPIGPKAWNLSAEWLAMFARSGRLDRVPAVARRVPLWEDRAKVPVAMAARGYLEANCAHCHNPRGAASNSGLYLGWDVTDPVQLGVGKRPVAAGRGAGNLEFDIVPGDPAHSILAYRMASLEGGVAMPEVGRGVVDPAGQAVVERWIKEMTR